MSSTSVSGRSSTSFDYAVANAAHVEIAACAELKGNDGHAFRHVEKLTRSGALQALVGPQMQNRRNQQNPIAHFRCGAVIELFCQLAWLDHGVEGVRHLKERPVRFPPHGPTHPDREQIAIHGQGCGDTVEDRRRVIGEHLLDADD